MSSSGYRLVISMHVAEPTPDRITYRLHPPFTFTFDTLRKVVDVDLVVLALRRRADFGADFTIEDVTTTSFSIPNTPTTLCQAGVLAVVEAVAEQFDHPANWMSLVVYFDDDQFTSRPFDKLQAEHAKGVSWVPEQMLPRSLRDALSA